MQNVFKLEHRILKIIQDFIESKGKGYKNKEVVLLNIWECLRMDAQVLGIVYKLYFEDVAIRNSHR